MPWLCIQGNSLTCISQRKRELCPEIGSCTHTTLAVTQKVEEKRNLMQTKAVYMFVAPSSILHCCLVPTTYTLHTNCVKKRNVTLSHFPPYFALMSQLRGYDLWSYKSWKVACHNLGLKRKVCTLISYHPADDVCTPFLFTKWKFMAWKRQVTKGL